MNVEDGKMGFGGEIKEKRKWIELILASSTYGGVVVRGCQKNNPLIYSDIPVDGGVGEALEDWRVQVTNHIHGPGHLGAGERWSAQVSGSKRQLKNKRITTLELTEKLDWRLLIGNRRPWIFIFTESPK